LAADTHIDALSQKARNFHLAQPAMLESRQHQDHLAKAYGLGVHIGRNGTVAMAPTKSHFAWIFNEISCIEAARHQIGPMSKFEEFASKLRPGRAYRRADLAQWSTSVDRHLKQAVETGRLNKASGGLYYAPKQTAFGAAPAEDETLVSTFLKGGPFLMASPNAYNGLGVGTTQLHNRTVVYNHKRHGEFTLGGRAYEFRMKPAFPRQLSREFLLVDLVNNLDQLGEDRQEVLRRVEDRLRSADTAKLKSAAKRFGSEKAKRFFRTALAETGQLHAA